ncbi:M4 family metallopeptidase [Legionella sp. km772]|uniref:M4 family metallopeptidase n=1 Tax=Legionella sp. km772 TaxID=2498111 RepID=UPI000F8DBE36|nr:M4 family metallopeptidase [Legionella sp. km772]RUR04607.1 peptidase M4 family protein [Legionella sp. km772]
MRRVIFLASSVLFSSGIGAAQWQAIDSNNFTTYLQPEKGGFKLGDKNQFKLEKKIVLSNGVIKNKFVQYYQGIPVFSSQLSSTGLNNENVWGRFLAEVEQDLPNIKPTLSAQDAISLAKRAKTIKASTGGEQANLYVIYDKATKQAKLIYLVSFMLYEANPKRPYFIIDAHSQKIIDQWDGLTTRDAQGPGGNAKTGAYYYGRDFSPLQVSDSCEMKTDRVETYNLNGRTSGEVLFKFTCPENTYKAINGAYSPLNDAHYFGNIVFEMYKNWYNISPLTTKLKLRVHYGQNYENAFWDGQQMTFGDGGNSLYPLTSLDVVAHEVSHGVTEQNSNLNYQYQSGAINEAFSDMAGEVAEYYMQHQLGKENDWMVGASILKGGVNNAMRYFDRPSKDGRSIESAKDYNDSLDVHYTSGVYNKAFYTLATKNNWGIRKAFEVFLVANQVYWTADASFDSAACGVVKAANDLNYETNDVIASFNAVSVNGNCINPDPNPDPDPKEIELKNGQIISPLAITPNSERRFMIKVPSLPSYPYTYKYLIVRLFNDAGTTKNISELFVRYDNESIVKQTLVRTVGKEEFFYLQLPSAGYYHLLITHVTHINL